MSKLSVEMRAKIIGEAAVDPAFQGQARADHVAKLALQHLSTALALQMNDMAPDPLPPLPRMPPDVPAPSEDEDDF